MEGGGDPPKRAGCVFSEISDSAWMVRESLRWDCGGWEGMFGSLSSGGGVSHGDSRLNALLMEKMEKIQL